MSWSFSLPATPVDEFDDALQAAHDAANIPPSNTNDVKQAKQAVKAACALVKAGVVGDEKVAATLSGHASAGQHDSNSRVNVSVWFA